jgi:hypothetical protein
VTLPAISDKERARIRANVRLRQSKIRGEARAHIATLKANGTCTWCGRTHVPPPLLGFHHRDPDTKQFEIHRMASTAGTWRQLDRLKAEIGKCDLICVWCHVAHHVHLRRQQRQAAA